MRAPSYKRENTNNIKPLCTFGGTTCLKNKDIITVDEQIPLF